ncbi:helix-turn-helix domain-containing protein [Microbulbifer sp. SAOS-129_SWC]|uniref:helix-turn-helix domain-containing protein n=1 Tax=Microbulbifer sp. SAOS-129_SWC TaxID=3145235 RepID=UPI0032167F13
MAALGVLMERFTLAAGGSPLIYSLEDKMVAAEHGVRVQAQVLPADTPIAHTLVICGGRRALEVPVPLCQRLARGVVDCGYLVGIASGGLLLAQLGLLRNRQLSLPESLQALLPPAERCFAQSSGPFSRDGHIWTCSGEESVAAMLDTLLPMWRGGQHGSRAALNCQVDDRALLAEAQALMRNNLSEPLATSEIAGYLGVTCKKLERVFRRFACQLPARFYIGLRLSLARDLLHHSGCSIEEIGHRCGFSSPSHFSRAFRNHFGCSPRTERQQFTAGPGPHWIPVVEQRRAS